MFRFTWPVVLSLIIPLSTQCPADEIVFDDFDDKDLTGWLTLLSGQGASANTDSGDLHLSSPGSNAWVGVAFGDRIAGDVSLRTQVRHATGVIGLAVKGRGEGYPDAYWLALWPDGVFVLTKNVDGVETWYDEVPVTPVTGTEQEVIIQLDVLGDAEGEAVTGWLWPADGTAPQSPTFSYRLEEPLLDRRLAGVWSAASVEGPSTRHPRPCSDTFK
jgi:hypothetical protein